jgi:hypothetical protein
MNVQEEILAALTALFKPGDVVEFRALGRLKGRKTTISGYFNDFEKFAQVAAQWSGSPGVEGCYFTLNPCNPALLARCSNKAKQGATVATSDKDVLQRTHLLVDCDYDRPAGISATEDEKKFAAPVAKQVKEYLSEKGWPEPFKADSGNGYHLVYNVDLPNDEASRDLVQSCLEVLAAKFDIKGKVKIDKSVYNAARLDKLYGTLAAKGESTPERPHRYAHLRIPDEPPQTVSLELLQGLAVEVPPKKQTTSTATPEKMEEFLSLVEISHRERVPWDGGWKWQIDKCPFDPSHTAPDAFVAIGGSGALIFHCSHNSCAENKWDAFRCAGEKKLGRKFQFTRGKPLKPKTKFELSGGEIVYGFQELEKCVLASEAVLNSINGKYFENNRNLVMPSYARDEEKIEDIERDKDSVILAPISRQTIARDLDSNARFVGKSVGDMGIVYYPMLPPQGIADHILDRVKHYPNEIPYPHLDMLVNTPVLLPSGEIHDSPGKLREGVLLIDSGIEFPRIEMNPSLADAKAALKLFEPIFSGFPFSEKGPDGEVLAWNLTGSYSVILASILTLCARSVLHKSVPLFGVSAPTPGTGKTHLVASAVLAALGYRPTVVSYLEETEFGKALLPILQAQDRAVLIDNLAVPLRSSKLCMALSDSKMKDRILGKSELISLDNRSTFFCTGNHLTIVGDLTRRTLLASLDCNLERPETREFNFDPEQRARESHKELLRASLLVLRAYITAGKPWSLKRSPLGGFESWDELISGALHWAGYPDPVSTINTVVADDPDRESNLQVLRAWHREFGDASVSVSEIDRKTGSEIRALFLSKEDRWDSRSVGWRLRYLRDKVIDGLKLIRARGPGGKDGYWWRVTSVGQTARDAAPGLDF